MFLPTIPQTILKLRGRSGKLGGQLLSVEEVVHTRTYLRSTSGLDGTPPGVFTLTGSDLVPSPFLVRAATYKYPQQKYLDTLLSFA